jgi:hypothetical protein
MFFRCVCDWGEGGHRRGFNREMCVTTDKKRTHFNGIAHIILLDNINHQNHNNNISITHNNPQQRRRNVM